MNDFLKAILDGIYGFVGNYGLSVVLFTILIRLCLMPLDYKSRKGMRKMNTLLPKQQELQKKYGHDQDKLNRKMQELYKKEGASPMSGCWPMLLSMPILFAMFAALRYMANEQLVSQAFDIVLHGEPQLEPFLWIKNLWMPDSPFSASWPNLQSLKLIEEKQWLSVINAMNAQDLIALAGKLEIDLSSIANAASDLALLDEATLTTLTAELQRYISATAFIDTDSLKVLSDTIAKIGALMEAEPGYINAVGSIDYMTIPLVNWSVKNSWNGLFILPLLSAGSQFLMTKLTSAQQPAQPAPTNANGEQQPNTGNFMKWFFPLFSLWICLSYTAAFALYWVVSNLIHLVQNQLINWYLDRKDSQAAIAADVTSGKGGVI